MKKIKNSKFTLFEISSNEMFEFGVKIDKSIDIFGYEKFSNKPINKINKFKNVIDVHLILILNKDKDVIVVCDISKNITNFTSNSINLNSLVSIKNERVQDLINDGYTIKSSNIRITTKNLENSNASVFYLGIRNNFTTD